MCNLNIKNVSMFWVKNRAYPKRTLREESEASGDLRSKMIQGLDQTGVRLAQHTVPVFPSVQKFWLPKQVFGIA